MKIIWQNNTQESKESAGFSKEKRRKNMKIVNFQFQSITIMQILTFKHFNTLQK